MTQATIPLKNESYNPSDYKAQKFSLWLGIFSLSMTFAGLTSAYLVRKSAGNWDVFNIPSVFYTSTFIIILSSVAMHVAHSSNKKGHTKMLKVGLLSTLLLGIAFCCLQYVGWNSLIDMGVYLEGNVSGSFFYVITGMHFAHVIGGLLFLAYAFIRSSRKFKAGKSQETYKDRNNNKLWIRTELISMYWHFVGVLWIYLFVFLSINHL